MFVDRVSRYYDSEPKPGQYQQPNGTILLTGRVLLRRVTFADAINGMQIERFSPNMIYPFHCMFTAQLV